MHSNYDPDLNMLMIGFSPERLNNLVKTLESYCLMEGAFKMEAGEMITFLEASKMAVGFYLLGKGLGS